MQFWLTDNQSYFVTQQSSAYFFLNIIIITKLHIFFAIFKPSDLNGAKYVRYVTIII